MTKLLGKKQVNDPLPPNFYHWRTLASVEVNIFTINLTSN